VQVTALGKDTYLSKIIAIVEQAQNSKPQIQKFADQIMTYFVPSILLIAIGAGLFWLFL
jgi:Cu+-exporting ATPase